MKRCKRCHVQKSLQEFHNCKDSSDGRNRWCKVCARLASKTYQRALDPKIKAAKRRRHYITHRKAEIENTLAKRDARTYKGYMNAYYKLTQARVAKHYSENTSLYKDRSLRTKFGIGLEDYYRILQDQGGLCAICNASAPDKSGSRKFFFVDHDHDSSEVRGLLCHLCNFELGCYKDSITHLTSAIKYLQNHHARIKSGASLGRKFKNDNRV